MPPVISTFPGSSCAKGVDDHIPPCGLSWAFPLAHCCWGLCIYSPGVGEPLGWFTGQLHDLREEEPSRGTQRWKILDSQEDLIFSGWSRLPLNPDPLPELWVQVEDGSPLTLSCLGSGCWQAVGTTCHGAELPPRLEARLPLPHAAPTLSTHLLPCASVSCSGNMVHVTCWGDQGFSTSCSALG